MAKTGNLSVSQPAKRPLQSRDTVNTFCRHVLMACVTSHFSDLMSDCKTDDLESYSGPTPDTNLQCTR